MKEMNINQALNYIFGEQQEELLQQEELEFKTAYEDMTVKELKEQAKNKGLKGTSKLKKDELINLLNEQSEEQDDKPFEVEENKNIENEKENDNMKNSNNNQMEMMMAQMQAMMDQVQQLTNTVAQLSQENAELKAKANNNTTANAPKYNKEESMKKFVQAQVMDNYMKDVNRDEFKKADRLNGDVNDVIMDISDRIHTALNPSFYANILLDYEPVELQNYYQRALTIQGLFSKEYDNLESLSKEQLIKGIKDLEEDLYVNRMLKNNKKVYASEKQIELLQQNGIDTTNIKYWWDASPILEGLFGANQKPSISQLTKINELITLTGAVGFNTQPQTKKEASQIINSLMDSYEEMYGVQMASEKQIETYKKMANALNLEVPEYITELSSREISNDIRYLSNRYNKVATASEGQIKFIKSLCAQTLQPVPENIETINKADASKLIDKMSRELLYIKMRRTMQTITRDEIKKLTRQEVQEKLNEYRANGR